MNSEFLIGKIGGLIVEDLLKETQKLSKNLFNSNKAENEKFILRPDLLSTTNLLSKNEPNNDGDDDEDMKFFIQKIYQKQMRKKTFCEGKVFPTKRLTYEVDKCLSPNSSNAATNS